MRNAQYEIKGAGLGLLLLLLSGCASPSIDAPAWLVNPQEEYPESRFLVAVGEGDTRRAAENSASAGLARIFESKVQAQETLSETTTEMRGAQESFDQFSELRATIRIGSNQDLLNIQFGQTFTDHNGRIYAAAFIQRAETTEIYRARIAKNNAAVVHLTHLSDVADDPLNAYAFRRAAVRKALENDRLLAQLSIINPGAKDRTSLHYDAQELYTEAAAAARNVTFSVALPGASGNALREALTGMGFSEGNPATLAFSGTTEFEETDLQRRTLVFVRYRYTIEAVTQDQNLILSLHGSRREGHINFSEATARAQRSLRSELLSTVPRELGSYFDRITSAEQK